MTGEYKELKKKSLGIKEKLHLNLRYLGIFENRVGLLENRIGSIQFGLCWVSGIGRTFKWKRSTESRKYSWEVRVNIRAERIADTNNLGFGEPNL